MSLCQNYCCLQKNDWCQNIWIYFSWSSMCMSQCCRHSIVSEAEPFGANFGLRFCAFKNSLVDEVCFSCFFSRLFSLFFYTQNGLSGLCNAVYGNPARWFTSTLKYQPHLFIGLYLARGRWLLFSCFPKLPLSKSALPRHYNNPFSLCRKCSTWEMCRLRIIALNKWAGKGPLPKPFSPANHAQWYQRLLEGVLPQNRWGQSLFEL